MDEILFPNIKKIIQRYKKKLDFVIEGSINRDSQNYKIIISKFENNIIDDVNFVKQKITLQEAKYLSYEMLSNKVFFQKILLYSKNFQYIMNALMEKDRVIINKNMIKIYFSYFNLLCQNNSIKLLLETRIKNFLLTYDKKNSFFIHCKEEGVDLYDPQKILMKYQDDIELIKKRFKFSDSDEYFQKLLSYRFVARLKTLNYDEEDKRLFEEIMNKQEIAFDFYLNIKEYVTFELLARAFKEKKIFPNWQKFILALMGDPRSYNIKNTSWDKVDSNLLNFFVSQLSKEDLKLFLEHLSFTDITNYKYRKAFWSAFSDYVLYAKLMIGEEALLRLPKEMQENVKRDNTSYARYKKIEQSAIYIDFGDIKVIEFTHNGKVSGFDKVPIDLNRKNYSEIDLKSLGVRSLFSIVHSSPNTYSWQKIVLKEMNEYLNCNVKEQDILIDEDKKKRNMYF